MPVVPNATILISSCDAFADCWPPYMHGLTKYWPDCPYSIYIITNFRTDVPPPAQALAVGTDRGWTANTRAALERIDTPFVIYTHEDFWIKAPVRTRAIVDYVALLEAGAADYVRLYPWAEHDRPFTADPRLNVLAETHRYRACLQMAAWRKSVFMDLLRDGENPWQFEIQGSVRSRQYADRFVGVRRFINGADRSNHEGIDYVCTAINKGRWSPEARRYADAEQLAIDFSNRPPERWFHRGQISRVISLPRRVKGRVRRMWMERTA
jgi:hypothetical protein